MFHRGNTRVERTPNKSQHTKLTPEKKILPTLPPGFELGTFRSRVRRSYHKLSRPPLWKTRKRRNIFDLSKRMSELTLVVGVKLAVEDDVLRGARDGVKDADDAPLGRKNEVNAYDDDGDDDDDGGHCPAL